MARKRWKSTEEFRRHVADYLSATPEEKAAGIDWQARKAQWDQVATQPGYIPGLHAATVRHMREHNTTYTVAREAVKNEFI